MGGVLRRGERCWACLLGHLSVGESWAEVGPPEERQFPLPLPYRQQQSEGLIYLAHQTKIISLITDSQVLEKAFIAFSARCL